MIEAPTAVLQLCRTRGWRLPQGVVVVARPSRWGNPFRIADGFTREEAVALYAVMLASMPWHTREDYLEPLLGASALACWCEPPQPCHATVLAGWLDRHRLDEAAEAASR